MQKIKSLFKRDYKGSRQVYDEVVPGSEWVLDGEGVATPKIDGTCCKIDNGELYKRYDRKLTKSAHRRKKNDKEFVPSIQDFKPSSKGWIAAEAEPNKHTGHWPGWVLVGDEPDNKWHREAFGKVCWGDEDNGTYELIGPKIQGNPYNASEHCLLMHKGRLISDISFVPLPLDYEGIKKWLTIHNLIEGIVWHHPDGRMVKIKRSDFGLEWPTRTTKQEAS